MRSNIIGLLGGMSPQSTLLYYKWINEEVGNIAGSSNSAEIVLRSVNFENIQKLQHANDWDKLAFTLADHAATLEKAGASFIGLCTNTMHKVSDSITDNIGIPFIHIADTTGTEIVKNGIGKVGLLGTKFTMKEGYYKDRLHEKNSLDVIVPNEKDMDSIHAIIYDELCRGVVKDQSRETFINAIKRMEDQGAEGIIAGCTEITMLISQEHMSSTYFDTTRIHANELARLSLLQ